MKREEQEGWSDSFIRTNSLIIHYYKKGVSICGRCKVDMGNKVFETSKKDINDKYSQHCKLCIKKQNKSISK
jgi:hypothetical protein